MLVQTKTIQATKILENVPQGDDIYLAAVAIASVIMEYDNRRATEQPIGELHAYTFPFVMEVNEIIAFNDVHELNYVTKDMLIFLRGNGFVFSDGAAVDEVFGLGGIVNKCYKACKTHEEAFIQFKSLVDETLENALESERD